MIVNVYVDGFNLYHGVTKSQPYKWLDINRFALMMLQPNDVIGHIWYCTADVDGSSDPQAPARQQAYFRALETLPNLTICKGLFKTTYPMMKPRNGGPAIRVRKREEKGSDVNLGSHLLLDAFKNDFQAALIISNDSDLVTPIEMVTSYFRLPVGVAMPLFNPGRKPSADLLRVASFTRAIKNDKQWRARLRKSQFPDTLTDARGTFGKPAKWKTHPY